MILQAVVGGFVLDALFGDPAWLPHPVCLWADVSPGWKSSCAPACPAPRRESCWAVP